MGTFARAEFGLTLAVVIPVFNEARFISETIEEVLAAATPTHFKTEVVVVDDGSTDATAELAARAGARVVRQPNGGRFEARQAGLAVVSAEYVLLLDGRTSLEPGALAFVADNLTAQSRVWNGHAVIDTKGNPYGRFWDVVSALAFARYFDSPATTSFGLEEFDAFPKGTTCFFAPRELLVEAFESFQSRYTDTRHANDDTPLIRWIAARDRIWISPQFACLYRPRRSLRAFLRHAFHRGVVFLDGHGRRESRYRPVVLAFYPVSVAMVVGSVLWPPAILVIGAVVVGVSAIGALHKRRPVPDVISFAVLAPFYALAHGLGMWRALAIPRR